MAAVRTAAAAWATKVACTARVSSGISGGAKGTPRERRAQIPLGYRERTPQRLTNDQNRSAARMPERSRQPRPVRLREVLGEPARLAEVRVEDEADQQEQHHRPRVHQPGLEV